MNKQDYVKRLIDWAYKVDNKRKARVERTKTIQKMASLSRLGHKDGDEFRSLEKQYKHMCFEATDFGNELNELEIIVKRLKKYKF